MLHFENVTITALFMTNEPRVQDHSGRCKIKKEKFTVYPIYCSAMTNLTEALVHDVEVEVQLHLFFCSHKNHLIQYIHKQENVTLFHTGSHFVIWPVQNVLFFLCN